MRVSKGYRPNYPRLPLDPPADALALDAMAVVDAFAEAWERGEVPRLSEWLRRYPEHAEALADYAAAFLSEQGTNSEDAGTEEGLSQGTQRALDMIARAGFSGWPPHQLPRVAEAPSGYEAASEATDDEEA